VSIAAAPGRQVEMRFRLQLEDGTEVEATAEGETFVFEMGDGTLDAGLEARLEGLTPGRKATFRLAPGEAFGDPDPAAVHPMARDEFPADMELAPGAVVGFTTPAGDEVAGTVMELLGQTVVMDFNHPLAGRALVFQVEILAVT
jgi:FKBP-type peptidyl-prolyl cis-trans isomerase SlpA